MNCEYTTRLEHSVEQQDSRVCHLECEQPLDRRLIAFLKGPVPGLSHAHDAVVTLCQGWDLMKGC
jgi:hypothetical protein